MVGRSDKANEKEKKSDYIILSFLMSVFCSGHGSCRNTQYNWGDL